MSPMLTAESSPEVFYKHQVIDRRILTRINDNAPVRGGGDRHVMILPRFETTVAGSARSQDRSTEAASHPPDRSEIVDAGPACDPVYIVNASIEDREIYEINVPPLTFRQVRRPTTGIRHSGA